ncbi:hypothetical protein BYT27DRAFT_7082415 [Phlegmacium glaucopus]|nr:hypothetical protein BYT27DRAFT_7082415 [Phlegmacium glaucopus]
MTAQASWADRDVTALLNFLLSKKATAGDGLSFKAVVWNEAATVANLVTGLRGAQKTASSCKNKFAKLKEVFLIVAAIKGQSGFKWDDERGADIGPESEAVWEAYEKKHKGAAPFRNKGWPWYDQMLPLMPTAPRGANVYQPSSVPQTLVHGSVPEESQEMESQPISNWVKCQASFFSYFVNPHLLVSFSTT